MHSNKIPQIKVKKLEIGCGNKLTKGFTGIDRRDCGQEIIWDVRNGLPFPDESIDEIYSCHVMEHFDNEESEELLREIYRVLRKGGTTTHLTPHATDPSAFYFDHKTFWNEGRVETIPGFRGLEGFKVLQNQAQIQGIKHLLFKLQK